MLVKQLPPESATATVQRLEAPPAPPRKGVTDDAEHEQWSRAEQLIAAVKDELQALRHSYISAHSKHPPKWKPTPTPRPGVKPKRARKALTEEQVGALEAYLAQAQGEPSNN